MLPPLIEMADASAGSMRRAALDLFAYVRGFLLDQVQREMFQLLDRRAHGAGLESSRNSFQEIFARVVNAGARYGLETLEVPLRKRPTPATIAGSMSFNMQNPRVADFIRGYVFSLISGISQETQAGIQTLLLHAVTQGIAPAQQARFIQPMIGLTERDAQAALNYRRALEERQYRSALDRALRDGRYDRMLLGAIQRKEPLKQQQIDAMVQRYVERSLRNRAENIARTETIRAAHAGLRESWRQAQEQGFLKSGTRQKWILATDERRCDICPQVVQMNPDGVLLGSKFRSPVGLVDGPPLHPRCRCSMGLVL
jgi:hypothetical protein